MVLALLLTLHAAAAPEDWTRVQRDSAIVGWVGVGASGVGALSAAAMVTGLFAFDLDSVPPGWYAPTLVVGLIGPGMAAAGSLRNRQAGLRLGGAPRSPALGIASWATFGVAIAAPVVAFVASDSYSYGYLFVAAFGSPLCIAAAGGLAAGQLIANERTRAVLASAVVLPVFTGSQRGMALSVRF